MLLAHTGPARVCIGV